MGGGGQIGQWHRQWTGVADQAEAASGAAMAAEAEARSQRSAMLSEGHRIEDSALNLAKASPQELQSYDAALSAAFKQNDQDARLMQSIDPALLEASHQVLSLIKGEQTSTGGAFDNLRNQQRQRLVSSLREQYGPGGEATAPGMKALSDFDMSSVQGSMGMREQSLSSLTGFMQARPTMGNSFGMLTQAGQNFGGIQQRQVGAQLGAGGMTLDALKVGNSGVSQTVGSQYTGQLIRGRGQQQDHKTGVEFMSTIGGAMAGKEG